MKAQLSGGKDLHRSTAPAGNGQRMLPGTGSVGDTRAKTRGRQRSEESEDAILCSTLQLLKTKPLRDVSIEEIARKAGVGKATIYKWWPSKAYVALDAFLRKMNRMVPNPDTGSAESDLKKQIHYLATFYTSPTGRIFGQFLAEAQSDPEFAGLLRERFMKPRREIAGVIFDRAVSRGEIDPSLDRDLVLDLIYGPVLYRLLIVQAPFGRRRVDALVSALFTGLRRR
ncbi:MAG TPA: TetR/AcrR family transcriptional regulator [Terracidiphilus sp.]